MENHDLIQQIPLFSSLPHGEIHHLDEVLRQVEVPAGKLLFQEGEPGDRFSIILDGQIEILKALNTEDERVLAVRGPGDFLGEMSLVIEDGQRSASARSRTTVHMLEMTHKDFVDLLIRQPALGMRILRGISMRLRDAENATIRDLQEKNRQLALAFHELQAAQAQLIEKEKLEHELSMARKIQENMLPRTLPSVPGYSFGARMEPARAVGGDFFDFIQLDRNRLAIIIADVSDKGVPAALFMAQSCSLLRAAARASLSPAKVLQRVNRFLLEVNQSDMFVTVLYGVLNQKTGEMRYARAGHEFPLALDAGGSLIPSVHGLGQPLGLFPDPVIEEQALVIPPGGLLLMFTDGVTEAADARDSFFGLNGIRETVCSVLSEPAQAICDRLLHTVLKYHGPGAQGDDITLVAARREA